MSSLSWVTAVTHKTRPSSPSSRTHSGRSWLRVGQQERICHALPVSFAAVCRQGANGQAQKSWAVSQTPEESVPLGSRIFLLCLRPSCAMACLSPLTRSHAVSLYLPSFSPPPLLLYIPSPCFQSPFTESCVHTPAPLCFVFFFLLSLTSFCAHFFSLPFLFLLWREPYSSVFLPPSHVIPYPLWFLHEASSLVLLCGLLQLRIAVKTHRTRH